MRLLIVSPAAPGSRSGNETTSTRWQGILERLGHQASVVQRWDGEPCDALIAMHAWKSVDAIRAFSAAHPARPLIVALTGTDVYREEPARLAEALERATRLVVLQPLALAELPQAARARARVIHQSVAPLPRPGRRERTTFDVVVLAHLREVKDPFRAVLASRLLPPESRIRVVQVGGALDDGSEAFASEEQAKNPRYVWLGSVPRAEALRILAGSDALVNSSTSEGGANVVGEAICARVPVIASRIPGNVGLLGEDYFGTFPAGDTMALAALLLRVERDPDLRAALLEQGRRRQSLFDPAREEAAWRSLLAELS